jgi:hypothetical protein
MVAADVAAVLKEQVVLVGLHLLDDFRADL